MVKYGIIADTHITEEEKKDVKHKLIRKLKDVFEDADFIIHCGDEKNKEFLEELRNIAPVKIVKGHEEKDSDYEEYITFESDNIKIGVTHELPQDLKEFCEKKDLIGGILIYGHTHQPMIKGTDFNTLLINPGSPTKPIAPPKLKGFREPTAKPSVLILTIEEGMVTTLIVNLKFNEDGSDL
jgi:putative phosphoesterase